MPSPRLAVVDPVGCSCTGKVGFRWSGGGRWTTKLVCPHCGAKGKVYRMHRRPGQVGKVLDPKDARTDWTCEGCGWQWMSNPKLGHSRPWSCHNEKHRWWYVVMLYDVDHHEHEGCTRAS